LNDYTAVDNDNFEQSPQTINLDDSQKSNVQSNPDPCTIIDLSEESDPELQQFVSNNEPVLSHQIHVIVIPIKVILRHQLYLLKLEAELKHIVQYLLIEIGKLQLMPDHKDQ